MPSARATGSQPSTLGDLMNRVRALEQRIESAHPENASAMAERMANIEASCRGHVNSTVALLNDRGKAVNKAVELLESRMSAAEAKLMSAVAAGESRVHTAVGKAETCVETIVEQMKGHQDAVAELQAAMERQGADLVSTRVANETLVQKLEATEKHVEETFAAITEQGEKTEEMFRKMQEGIEVPLQARREISPREFYSRQAVLQTHSLDNAPAAIRSAQQLARPRSLSIDRQTRR